MQRFQYAFRKEVSCSYEIIFSCIENLSLGDIEGINKNRRGKIKTPGKTWKKNNRKDVGELGRRGRTTAG